MIPELKDLKPITDYDKEEQRKILDFICAQMYIARNITLSQNTMQDCFKRIDRLYRDDENFN